MDDNKVLIELEELIKTGKSLGTKLDTLFHVDNNYGNNDSFIPASRKWEHFTVNLLKLRFGKNSEFLENFINALGSKSKKAEYYKENVNVATAVLEYIYDSLSKGLTDDLFFQREMVLFGDMLKQADEFLRQKLPIAAAIYGRIILELSIVEYGVKHGITDRMNFDQLIINLRKNGAIHEPFEVSLRANYKIGSLAAHGDPEFSKLSDSEIREFLSFIRDKVLTLE